MNKTSSPAPKKRRNLGRKIFLTVFVTIIGLYLALPLIIKQVANRQLPKNLNVPASLGGVKLSLLRGELGLRNVIVPQPDGFGSGNAIELGSIDLKVDTGSLKSEQMIVNEISIKDTHIHAVMNADKELNFTKVAKPAEATPDEPQPETDEEATPVLIERIHLENVHITWSGNPVFPDKDLSLTITNLTVDVKNLLLDPNGAADHRSDIALSFEIPQAEGPAAQFALDAILGALGQTAPSINATSRLTGFQLKTVQGLLVPGASMAVGGDVLDLGVDLQLSREMLAGKMDLSTENGSRDSFNIGGTIEKPDLPFLDLFGNMFARPAEAAMKVVGDAGKATLDVVVGVEKAGVELAKGAGQAVTNVGKNTGKLLGGLLKGDIKGAGQAAIDATAGTVTGAAKSIADSGKAAGDGVVHAAGDVTGSTESNAWIAESKERFNQQRTEAMDVLKNMPWPPSREEASDDSGDADTEEAVEEKPAE